MATRKQRGRLKGRVLVAWGLLLVLGVSSIVIWRRTSGYATAQDIRKLDAEKNNLLSTRTTLRKDIQDANTRDRVIAAAARRLGLTVATEAQTRSLVDTVVVPDSAR